MAVEPGSVVVAPLGPRQLLGVAWEAERLPTNEVGDNRLRPLAGMMDVPPLAAPLRRLVRMDRRLLSKPARLRAADGAAVIGGAGGLAPTDRISADRARPRPPHAAARKGACGARRPAGHDPRTGRSCGVSDAVMRGLVNAGALEAVAVDADRPLAARIPTSRRPSSMTISARRRPASPPRSARGSIRCCSTA